MAVSGEVDGPGAVGRYGQLFLYLIGFKGYLYLFCLFICEHGDSCTVHTGSVRHHAVIDHYLPVVDYLIFFTGVV